MKWEVVRDANEQQVLGACVGSSQGHVIGLSLHGWHLSSNLRTFLARLIVPFSSSELLALWPDSTRVWGVLKILFTANHGSSAPTGPWRGWSPPPC
jgi:hypothetical protein